MSVPEPNRPEQDEPQASFVIALPPGWVRLPARPAAERQLRSAIEEIVAETIPASLPRGSAEPWRGELRKRLTHAVVDAGDAGASAVYLPVRAVNGVVVPASFIESEIDLDGEDSPESVIAAIVGDAGWAASRRTVDGAVAARTDRSERRVQIDGDWPEVTTRQIVYTIGVPHREGRWLVLSFSVVAHDAADGALCDALVYLFDALMTTFRWSDVPGEDPSALATRLHEIQSR
ncbi:hypothetical protein E3T61_17160 [Cryobacterium lactosi]|uniref:Uncharacterized protein n=1 Tax=Cryobacterium lactosi TaxID=1259202 RepID=A0A4R9BLN7_9MICO|nr:hypothetical protein [Cryobacterium lactosi]TFD85853.1 hypothetical protein E3T61_17160 [Cryobacterium lactosi]